MDAGCVPAPTCGILRSDGGVDRAHDGGAAALRKAAGGVQSPLDWAGLASQLLQTMGWPGWRPPTSAEFQAANRWQQALDLCGSLGFDGRRSRWDEFVSDLDRIGKKMLFAEESQDAPILIAGPAESAGLTADGIWFLGADETPGPPQEPRTRCFRWMCSVRQACLMLRRRSTGNWPNGDRAPAEFGRQVCFSHAHLKEDVETRPSRLVAQHAGAAQALPAELWPEPHGAPLATAFEDTPAIPLPTVPARKNTAAQPVR